MNIRDLIQYLTIFLIGALLGLGAEFLYRTIFNAFCRWQGCTLLDFTWWKMLPMPLLLGIVMTIAVIRSSPGD